MSHYTLGGAIVVWGDNRGGGNTWLGADIYAQGVRLNGQLGGPAMAPR